MLYFVLGVLSVLALMLIGVLIFGMVKISKLTKSFNDFEQKTQRDVDELHRRCNETRNEIYNDLDRCRNEIDHSIKELYRYTDMRIDKSLLSKKEK